MRAFEALGRIGFLGSKPNGSPGIVGGVSLRDVAQDVAWRSFVEPRALYEAWSPVASSPWSGYAKPTLFAAMQGSCTPVAHAGLPESFNPTRRLVPEGTAVLLDLPGAQSVAYGAWLARWGGFQPVALFNNWPHPKGLVRMEPVLGALLHYLPWVLEGRRERVDAAPVFMLDRARFGPRKPMPGEFDNRYFHLETDFPSPARLRRHGITRLVHVSPTGEAAQDDLLDYLIACRGLVGLDAAQASPDAWEIAQPREYAPGRRKTVFNTVTDPAFAGFRRNAAGGFGRLVPEPSESGGGRYGGFG